MMNTSVATWTTASDSPSPTNPPTCSISEPMIETARPSGSDPVVARLPSWTRKRRANVGVTDSMIDDPPLKLERGRAERRDQERHPAQPDLMPAAHEPDVA